MMSTYSKCFSNPYTVREGESLDDLPISFPPSRTPMKRQKCKCHTVMVPYLISIAARRVLSWSNPAYSRPTCQCSLISGLMHTLPRACYSQTHPIQTQPINTPWSLNHTQFIYPLFPRRRPSTNIPFLCPQTLFKPFRRAIRSPPAPTL